MSFLTCTLKYTISQLNISRLSQHSAILTFFSQNLQEMTRFLFTLVGSIFVKVKCGSSEVLFIILKGMHVICVRLITDDQTTPPTSAYDRYDR